MAGNSPQQPPAMGWYPIANGDTRWWDGRAWTGMRIRGGAPGIDWATTEQPRTALTMAFIFLVLGLSQIGLYVTTTADASPVLAVIMLVNTALWFVTAGHGFALRRIPAPAVPPIAPDAIRPLPWEAETWGAGWCPMSPQTSRWWTGARWAQYTATRFGVRPTFHGPRAYMTYRTTMWALVGLGAAGVVAGIGTCALAADSAWTVIGACAIGAGVVLALVGALLASMSRAQRRNLLVPQHPAASFVPQARQP